MTKKEKRTIVIAAILVLTGAPLMLLRGLGMRFSGILLLGIACLLLIYLILCRWEQRSKVGKWCRRMFCFSCAFVLSILAFLETSVLMNRGGMPAVSADAVIVLGAGVNGTEPSLSLRTRLDAALDYLEENSQIPVVLTGGQGYGEAVTEAQCMYDYLTARGVASERILLEEKATSTAENFYFSKPLLEAEGIDVETDLIAVVTNDFHIYRSGLIAVREGYALTFGVPAELPWPHLEINYCIREAFALVKTLIFD